MDFSQIFSVEAIEQNVLPFLLGVGATGLRFVALLVAAVVLSRVLSRVVGGVIARLLAVDPREGKVAAEEDRKRVETLRTVAGRATRIAVWTVALVMALGEIGFQVAPLLASAGVAGIAIGFGAQNLVRDFLAGFFMLIENQLRVGDSVVINGQGGSVEQLNLRTTVLRDFSGSVHVIPNGAITQLANRTYEFSYYVFDVGVAYKEDVDRVMRVMKEVADELQTDEEFGEMILAPMEVLGLDRFADSAVIVKSRIQTLPIKQWAVGREYNRRLKMRFDAEKIEFPFPHRTVVIRGEDRDDDLRKLIREEMGKAQ